MSARRESLPVGFDVSRLTYHYPDGSPALDGVTLSVAPGERVGVIGRTGSGKSTMAFDLLHKEGQRQYMESLGMVTYDSRAPVDSITGLSPSISVDQHNRNRSPRSTVPRRR